MVLNKEYRICMPLTVEEAYINRNSRSMLMPHLHIGSTKANVVLRQCVDEWYANSGYRWPSSGTGRIAGWASEWVKCGLGINALLYDRFVVNDHRLPYWVQSFLPKVFYVTEKAWNYYPFTITEYTCSFIPKFIISIQTKFENNNGSSENCLNLDEEELKSRTVEFVDIAYDEVPLKSYKEEEDPRFFVSKETGRGPLAEGWRENTLPIMCSYKYVSASFEVWGLQTKAEDLIHKSIRDILLLGHRQAFAWIDEWINMSLVDVRGYESEMHRKTNSKVADNLPTPTTPAPTPTSPKTPTTPTSALASPKSWFSWS
ncbi:cytoplasmic phosphatidylinositol transfer protein 1 [Nilaparvata lugens]|uniref:cytoplasmic phosphatidylinositol transfer protein 1 n=1 Tax=Nilaparvata lugens TaxID=108931 RepID=UPI00193E5CA1|nr:cytoplasmic phosphatidylinositol transfer protein 1 [Nilaparvata lugens]